MTQKRYVSAAIHLMGDGTLDDFHAVMHPEFLNHEAKDEPPAPRARPGRPATPPRCGCAARSPTALGDREVVGRGRPDRRALHDEGPPHQVSSTTTRTPRSGRRSAHGRTFASTQTHWLRIADGQVIEHWANRDDLGTALQLGWVPPTPLYLARALFAKRKAQRLAAAA